MMQLGEQMSTENWWR